MSAPITIVCPILGARKMAEQCVSSWLPLPAGWEMLLWVNPASKLDGSDVFAAELAAKHQGVTVVEEKRGVYFGDNLDDATQLLTPDRWMLGIHQDTEVLHRSALKEIDKLAATVKPHQVLFGRTVCPQPIWNQNRIHMPRAACHFFMVRVGWVRNARLSWQVTEFRVPIDRISTRPRAMARLVADKTKPLYIGCDNGWMVYLSALSLGGYTQWPSDLLAKIKHHGAASRRWWTEQRALQSGKQQ
jgi:hypothetical protein